MAALALLLVVVGCGETQPTRFFTLSGLHAPADSSRTLAPGKAVGVGPVSLPDYLDRPQIVTRTGPNQASLSDFDSWIEPLATMVPRLLADDLAVLLDSDEVVTLPQRRAIAFAYQVEVAVSRFDVDSTGRAVLDARWYVLDGRERLLDRGRATLSERAAGGASDHAAVAAAMSRALGALSEQIADAILDHAG
jgi:uncharacterized lipoprotein YmbA